MNQVDNKLKQIKHNKEHVKDTYLEHSNKHRTHTETIITQKIKGIIQNVIQQEHTQNIIENTEMHVTYIT